MELAALFDEHPWAAYHVWQEVPAFLALPFLKAQLLGVRDENYGSLPSIDRPPVLRDYIAGALLAELGHSLAAAYRSRALKEATIVLNVLDEKRPQRLSSQERRDATNGLLIMLVENDARAINLLRDPALLEQYIRVNDQQGAETLRLLLDRLGPVAWTWAGSQPRIEPTRMLWRSEEELRQSAEMMPEGFLSPLQAQMEAWEGAESYREATTPGSDNPHAALPGSDGPLRRN
jgi:hypothetical protein